MPHTKIAQFPLGTSPETPPKINKTFASSHSARRDSRSHVSSSTYNKSKPERFSSLATPISFIGDLYIANSIDCWLGLVVLIELPGFHSYDSCLYTDLYVELVKQSSLRVSLLSVLQYLLCRLLLFIPCFFRWSCFLFVSKMR